MKPYTIRRSRIEDKVACNQAHRRSIREVCSADYSPEQIAAWSAVTYDDDLWANVVNHEFHVLVEVDGVVEGFCHARVVDRDTGEIMGLYLAPPAIGLGAGRAIVEMAMEWLISHGVQRVVIDGTRTAKGFYEHMGFQAKGCAKERAIRGALVECHEMEKLISR